MNKIFLLMILFLKKTKKDDNNLNLDNLQIYKKNKTLTIEQALEVLFSEKTLYLYSKFRRYTP